MTRGLKGEIISEMGDMVAHGAVAFTDDGRGVQGAGMMRRCMDYGKMFGKVFMSHCQDEDLVGDGQINEGPVSTKLGLAGWPAEGEELQILRDIQIARLTGAKLHIQHISTAHGIELVRAAMANPIGTILAAAMMLKYSFDMDEEAEAVEAAVSRVLDQGLRTGDMMAEGCTLVGSDKYPMAIAKNAEI